ncbi:hypothetical protein [Bdellovibrio bacteriovorus]|uniref:hypothetical protein n=1 Tax=Bdellovibrio bacteriovorus TaxID=959 RepID=UPI0035A6B1BF
MSLAMRPILGFLTTVLLASQVFANAAVNSSTAVVQQPKKEGRIWSGFFSASRSTNLYDFNDGTRRDGMDYSTRLNVKLGKNYSLRFQGGYSQDLKEPEYDDFSDISTTLQRSPFDLTKSLMMNYRVAATVPVSKDSRIRTNLITSLSTGVTFIINPDRLISGLDITGGLSVARSFHRYETALNGPVNTQYSSNQSFSVSYSFNSGVYVSADFLHRNTWSYQDVMRDSFDISQEIGYEINPTFTVAAGHSNSGSTLRPNGQDSAVDIVDENNSVVYGSLTVVF